MNRLLFLILCLLITGCNGSGRCAPDPSTGLGSEILIDPSLEAEYPAGMNVNWHPEGAVQAARSDTPRSGLAAQEVRLSISNDLPSNASANLTISAGVTLGQWYRASLWAKRTAGTAGDVYPWIYAPGGGVSYLSRAVASESYAQYVVTARATANILRLGINNGPSTQPSDTVVIDDASLRPIPFSSMVALKEGGSAYGKASTNLILQPGTQAGIVFCADSATNPQNYLLLYHDGQHIAFFKVIGGVYTPLTTGDDFYYYNVANNPAIAYVPGAALEIRRAPGDTAFAVYYNGHFVAQESVSDVAIVNNSIHGAFNTFEGNQVDYLYCRSTKKVVFLGGSITNGTGASQQKNGWQWLLRDYLDAAYPETSFSYLNAAKGATDSWYSLVRLKTDVLDHSPDIVFIDEAVNDGELDVSNPAWPYVGEALIRRIRSALPQVKIVVCNLMQPEGSDIVPDPSTQILRSAWNQIANYYHCDLYRFDTAILDTLPANPTRAQIGVYFTEVGGVHPNDLGHALIFSGLSRINMVADNVSWTGPLSSYARLSAATKDYEADSTILSGSQWLAGDPSNKGWTTPGNSDCTGLGTPSACCSGSGTGTCSGAKSATAGSLLTYTGEMTMVGLDVALQNGIWPKLQYSLDGGPWREVVPRSNGVWYAEFMYLPSPLTAHTLSIRTNTAGATINRLLVL